MAVFSSEISIQTPVTIERVEESPELKKLSARIDELGLSARSYNCLDRSDIKYIGQIAMMGQNDLKNVKNLGKKSLEEIIEKMDEYGFSVGSDLSDELTQALKKEIESE